MVMDLRECFQFIRRESIKNLHGAHQEFAQDAPKGGVGRHVRMLCWLHVVECTLFVAFCLVYFGCCLLLYVVDRIRLWGRMLRMSYLRFRWFVGKVSPDIRKPVIPLNLKNACFLLRSLYEESWQHEQDGTPHDINIIT